MSMDRLNAIVSHPLWQENMRQIRRLEQTRIFCGHDISHLMDVARLAYIENLEQNLGVPREQIYAAALLHDIGRAMQYTQGIPHHVGGARLAEEILRDCGFGEGERQQIICAISGHRDQQSGKAPALTGLLYRADKASRLCLFCGAQEQCNWSQEKKNLAIDR